MNDPKYASGIEYETKEPIIPKVTEIDNYTFVSGYSETAATLGMYYKNKLINFWTSTDGYFDTIIKVNLNNDKISDFLFENAFEDGSTLFALISQTKTDFTEKKVSDNYNETYCIEGGDTLNNLQPLTIKDLNNNGKNEIILNLIKLKDELISISCTDTFYIDR
jgi:hypothetical protein